VNKSSGASDEENRIKQKKSVEKVKSM
jgi:hypothetical protein